MKRTSLASSGGPVKKKKHVTLSVGGGSYSAPGSPSVFSQSVTSADLSYFSDGTAGVVSKPYEPPDDYVVHSKSRFEVFTYDEKMSQTSDDFSRDSDDDAVYKPWWARCKKNFDVRSLSVGVALTQMLAAVIHIFVRSVSLLYYRRHGLKLLETLDYVIFSFMLLVGSALLGAAFQMQQWLALLHSLMSLVLAGAITAVVVLSNIKNSAFGPEPRARLDTTRSVLYEMEAVAHIPFAICSALLYRLSVISQRKNAQRRSASEQSMGDAKEI